MAERAQISIVYGHIKVFINDAKHFGTVLAELEAHPKRVPAEPKSTPECLGEYAQAADKVMHAASLAYPGQRVARRGMARQVQTAAEPL